MTRTHFTAEYLCAPVHPITVDLVGCGGSGSIMLSCLASINSALISLGRTGLHVTAYDPDEVSEANLGRQLFSPADLGCNKADVLITRFNRIFGTTWESIPEKYRYNNETNIIISCTDNVASRKYISSKFPTNKEQTSAPEHCNYYWLDLGNGRYSGQAILGSSIIRQPKSQKFETVEQLPTVMQLYKLTKRDEKESGPSCSLAEALEKQDLFINRTVATAAADLLWKLFTPGHIEINGFFTNLEQMRTVPVEI